MMMNASMAHWLVVLLIPLLLLLIPAWRIVARTGLPGALSLLLVVPGLNLALIWIFAFVRWPIEKDPA